MKPNTHFLTIVLVALVSACASAPRPAVPGGKNRMPVNSETQMKEFQESNDSKKAVLLERSELSRQVENLSRKINRIEAYLAAKDFNERNTVGPRIVHTEGKAVQASNEEIDVRQQSIVFRIFHRTGESGFAPTEALLQMLLQSAQAGRFIEIRGRTDAHQDDAINEAIASQRAQAAADWLINNGIDADKIRISHLASGGYLANNSNADGRSRNRRVEIEVMDVDAANITGAIRNAVAEAR